MPLPKGYRALKPLHPNAGIRAAYQRRLDALVREMADSYEFWLARRYRARPPEIAQDAMTWAPRLVTAKETQIGGGTRVWHAYVDGELLRGKNGVGRSFRSQATAEAAGMREAGGAGVLTVPQEWQSAEWFKPISELELQPLPADNMAAELERLRERWVAKIDGTAPKLARWFATKVEDRSADGLRKILRDGGMTVNFQMTPAMRDVFEATVHENVSLIRSIASEYHTQVAGLVMRSVAEGRDLAGLTEQLEHRFGVTRRRAEFIALDQNNKATAELGRVRKLEAGLEKEVWLHSHAGKKPRKTHKANSGNVYDIRLGWHDPDPKVNRRIWPGQLPRCRCVGKPVVKGFS